MKTSLKFVTLALILGASFARAEQTVDCVKVSQSVTAEVTASQSQVLQIVEKFVKENPDCACEVVKASITAAKADVATVANIVEVAAIAAPEQMRLAAQCAIAVAPDAADAVQAVIAKLDPGTGDSGLSGKEVSTKGGTEKGGTAPEQGANPLDFPTNGGPNKVGPTPGGPGGAPLLPPLFPYQPPFVSPPKVTRIGNTLFPG